MEFFASVIHLGYLSTILYIVNLLIWSLLYKKIIHPFILLFIIIHIMLFVNIIVNFQPYNQGGNLWSSPSLRELLINYLLSCLLVFYINMYLKIRNLFNTFLCISFPCLSLLIYFDKILRCFYPFMVDLFGIVSTIVLFLEIKTHTKNSCLFIVIYPLLCVIVFISVIKIKFPIDLRSNNVMYLKTIYESDSLINYIYELHNIHDTEERLKKIIKVFDDNNQNGRYYFLEDTTAALSCCRNYIDNIWNEYSYNMQDYYSILSINYSNNMYLDNFKCHCDSTIFNIVSSDNNLINVKGDFCDLTLKRFGAFQKYLKHKFENLSSRKIALFNKDYDFKIGVKYFENDEYQLYLDKSFLQESSKNENKCLKKND